jgi:fermentation-respiration switch protein FrsA (DUF1100 family)
MMALTGGLVVALLVLAAAGAFTERLKRQTLFVPSVYPDGPWDWPHHGQPPGEHWFRSEDGTQLHGLMLESTPPSEELLLWFHGNAGNLSHRLPVAAELARRGLSVFLFDYRGYGRSRGRPSEKGLAQDSVAAFDLAASTPGRAPSEIVLYGESLGGAYAAWVARSRGGRCVVVENAFPSLRRMAQIYYPELPISWMLKGSLETARWLNLAGLPVLIMHGTEDAVIPFELGQELFEALEVPKEMLVVEGAGHSEMASVDGESYYRTVLDFVRRSRIER